MARRSKDSRNISVHDISYKWRATGDDGYIAVTIWPANNPGPTILCNFQYDETWIPVNENRSHSAGDQIVITNRLIRRVIEFAINNNGYDPHGGSGTLNLRRTDHLIDLSDAVRARSKRSPSDGEWSLQCPTLCFSTTLFRFLAPRNLPFR